MHFRESRLVPRTINIGQHRTINIGRLVAQVIVVEHAMAIHFGQQKSTNKNRPNYSAKKCPELQCGGTWVRPNF